MKELNKFTLAHYRDLKCHQWNRTCPSCGKREFSPYIDLFTGQPIDDKRCGRCNRETNCGYHLPPREWFGEHRTERREWLPREQYIALKRQERLEAEEARRRYEEEQRRKPRFDYFASEQPLEVHDYLCHMRQCFLKSQANPHTLAQWLYTLFPRERVDYALHRYRVGGTKDGRTVFWQVDLRDRPRAGKVMAYGHDGHRLKGCAGAMNWVHSLVGLKQWAPQCLFGEHLINDNVDVNENCYPLPIQGVTLRASLGTPSALRARPHSVVQGTALPSLGTAWHLANPIEASFAINRGTVGEGSLDSSIALVESEKTAIVMSILVPQTTWLATGGKQGFKHEMLWPLCGLDVAVYPDADALDAWTEKIEQLNREHGYHFIIPDHYRTMCTPEARERKWDLVDFLLNSEF